MTTNKQVLSVEEMREKVLEKFPSAFISDVYDEDEEVEGHRLYDRGGLGKPLSEQFMLKDYVWQDAYNRHCTAPDPSDAEIERFGEEQLDALAEMSATVAVKGKLLMQLINEIRHHRRTEAAYKRGKGEASR